MSFVLLFLFIGAATGETVDIKHKCEEGVGILTCVNVGIHNFIYSTSNEQITRVLFKGRMGGQFDVHNLPNVDTVFATESNMCCADIKGHAVELYNASGHFFCPAVKETSAPLTERSILMTEKTPGCSLAEEVDLVIIMDASTSVTAPNFKRMRDFCKDIVDFTDVDSGSARIGVLIYSTDVEIQFHLNEFNTTAAMKAAIDKIPYIYGSTNTADAIMIMYSRMFTGSNGDRPRVPNVGIVVTGGISNINSKRTIPEAYNARANDIKLYAIGIGLTHTRELDAIANTPTYRFRFHVDTFEELAGLAKTISGAGCATSAPDL